MEFFERFSIQKEKEDYDKVIETIDQGVVFKGTNLWILIFAIFIASLGLNVNSTAVIIGAMLVSPLMGPIMGIGLAMGINDLILLKKSAKNFLFAVGVSLFTSTFYFYISPLNEAHSEILARTTPNIYDVLIAFFGGLAGILATSSKLKGNVIPGVAIATALMPPLCTAGYGLASGNLQFFSGAIYLFLINTVFIALSTFVTVRFLRFPNKEIIDVKTKKRVHNWVGFIVVLTLVPSIYFGYEFIKEMKFKTQANKFITEQVNLKNNFIISKKVEYKDKTIELVIGGKKVDSVEINALKKSLKSYNLDETNLLIKEGFSFSDVIDNKTNNSQDAIINEYQNKLNEEENFKIKNEEVFKQIKVLFPEITSFVMTTGDSYNKENYENLYLCIIQLEKEPKSSFSEEKFQDWIKTSYKIENIKFIIL
ncbi:TIGR00341 family protein [Flavobacterium urocaniciphilum]|uniref:TIGR00341 family protein n=1 Tax=Flavobacterium urocaniciphilum TaxID=1299341 RepID=A0A1H8Z5P4_9FLAO|nr:TIGR00341 family protein [Flavobacterium urocaniciphilum]SEP59740.1 TIGR00341 family protein [Flavobacterium urocaniciphilum]